MEFRKYERRIYSLLGLQKILLPNSDSKKLLMTEQQLKKLSDNKVKYHSEIVGNSELIIKRTMIPSAFFENLNLFFEHKNALSAIAPYI